MSETNVQEKIAGALRATSSDQPSDPVLVDAQSRIASALRKEDQATPASTEPTETETPSEVVDETPVDESPEAVVTDEEDVVETVEDSDSEDSDPAETPAIETEDKATSGVDEEDVAKDSEEFWYEGPDAKYRNPEEGKRGLDAKARHIVNLTEDNKKVSADLVKSQSLNQFYAKHFPEDKLVEALVEEEMPEAFRGRNVEDLEPEDLKEYYAVRARAELKVKQEREKVERQNQDLAQQRAEKRDKARNFIDNTVTLDFFGRETLEEGRELDAALDTRADDGYSPRQKAIFITEVFGEEAGLTFLKGVRETLGGKSTSQTTPPKKKTTVSKPAPKAKAKPAAVKEEVIEKVSTVSVKGDKKTPAAPHQTQPRTGSPFDTIYAALSQGA